MPVVEVRFDKILPRLGMGKEELLEKLPYLGLDLEDVGEDYVKVEYNPNRPDYSTRWGIERGLKGLLGIEVGMPKFEVKRSGIEVLVDERVSSVRPYILCVVAKGLKLDDEAIKQLIGMQEDLHEGLGRGRRKVSIGLHDLDAIKPPLTYTLKGPSFRFRPLNASRDMSVEEVLRETEVGRRYGYIVEGRGYPMLLDSKGGVLAFPPIVNGDMTRVSEDTRNLFVDVTGTDMRLVEDVVSIIAATLSEIAEELCGVEVVYGDRRVFMPDMKPIRMEVELEPLTDLLGLKLSPEEAVECLRRCRIDATTSKGSLKLEIPRYRIDVMHPVDIAEEIMLGYGVYRLKPKLPRFKGSGSKDAKLKLLDEFREAMIGLGMIEVVNFTLLSGRALYDYMNRGGKGLRVENPKSSEYEALRDMLLPSLLLTLARNLDEEYPQKIFEVGRVFDGEGEAYHLSACIASSDTDYTDIKSHLTSLIRNTMGIDPETEGLELPFMIPGRSASVKVGGEEVGFLGEVGPDVLERFGLRVPVSAFELDLEPLVKLLGVES